MAELKIDDYTKNKSLDASLTRTGSPLHDFPFTDSLAYDSQYETDSQPVLTAGLFRTSRGPNRVQLATFNELGAQQGGLYLYQNDLIATAYTLGTIFFYDLSGNVSSVIQQSSPGLLAISATTEIDIIAPTIVLDGNVQITGVIAADGILAGSELGVTDSITAPSTIPGIAQIYVDSADGDLKVKFGDGTVKTLATNP